MDLIADIGATNSRCALINDKGRILSSETFQNADFTGVEGLLKVYLDLRRKSDRPRRAALAIAAPVLGDEIKMINIDWQVSQNELKSALDLHGLIVVNDFGAVAWGLPVLSSADRTQIGDGRAVTNAPMVVLGPGSGLGIASIVPSSDGWTAISGEGGHVTLAAANQKEADAIEQIRKRIGHCSAERVLSGPGLVNLYTALSELAGRGTPTVTPADVTALARQGEPLARDTLNMFFAMLGTVAGNLALTMGARGGVFIAGGIVPRLLDLLEHSPFRERLTAKGRYRSYLEAIPSYVLTHSHPAFVGLRSLLGYR
jgi:glucokinase